MSQFELSVNSWLYCARRYSVLDKKQSVPLNHLKGSTTVKSETLGTKIIHVFKEYLMFQCNLLVLQETEAG